MVPEVRGLGESSEYKTKEHLTLAHSRRRRRDRTSLHRTAMAHTELKIRRQFINAVEQELHGSAGELLTDAAEPPLEWMT